MHAAMAHRRALEGPLPRNEVRGEAERAHIGGHVRQPERAREVAEELEQPRPVGPLLHPPVLLVGEPGGDEVPGLARLVDGGDGAVARAGERAGALDDLLEHRVEVEAGADAQAGRAQGGDALAQRFDLAVAVVVTVQASLLARADCRTIARAAGRNCRPRPNIGVLFAQYTPLWSYISHNFVYYARIVCANTVRAGPHATMGGSRGSPEGGARAHPADRFGLARIPHVASEPGAPKCGVTDYGAWSRRSNWTVG